MDEEGISMEAFKEAFQKGNMFASGIGTLKRFILITNGTTNNNINYSR